MAAEPMGATESREIQKALTRYVIGEGSLLADSIRLISRSLEVLGVGDVQQPHEMHRFLKNLGFLKPGQNPFSIASRVVLDHDPAVPSLVPAHINPTDPYDVLRTDIYENIYAIDSKSTSEVDDAIGLRYDAEGREWITVYVSDATVHCPFDSRLETMTARSMTTTSYLPESVHFMLPTPIVEAATLREDRKCRTFNITFRIDDATGAIFDYSISLGWAHAMRRITYDATQAIFDSGARAPIPSVTPEWCTSDDIARLHRIHEIAKIRMRSRAERVEKRTGKSAIDSSVPDPLIKVDKATGKVLSVEDQVLGTKDARIAVAELMIAGNEACSRVAQSRKLSIPFRGTRPLSSDHLSSYESVPRPGVIEFPTLGDQSLVSRVFSTIESLSGVSRALYHHEPIQHVGLDTYDYCHSTSPLRRYPDMLVHHQLKVGLAKDAGYSFESEIQPFQMAELCQLCSTKQMESALLQDKSSYFWLLTFIKETLVGPNGDEPLECIVGCTREISGAMEEERHLRLGRRGYRFCSDVYLPRLQMVHFMYHNEESLQAGWSVFCKVAKCDPLQGILDLVPTSKRTPKTSAEDFIASTLVPGTLVGSA